MVGMIEVVVGVVYEETRGRGRHAHDGRKILHDGHGGGGRGDKRSDRRTIETQEVKHLHQV